MEQVHEGNGNTSHATGNYAYTDFSRSRIDIENQAWCSGIARVVYTNIPPVRRKTDDIIAVVVSICQGESYDRLFSTIPQVSTEGIVAVYLMTQEFSQQFLRNMNGERCHFQNTSAVDVLDELLDHLGSVSPDCVVFNWECCSGCTEDGFENENTILLISKLVEIGYTVMCSDFSLKALVSEWDSDLLGPNPFFQVGEFENTFEISFDAEILKASSSTQLQKLGELCEDGSATLRALGGTSAFSVYKEIMEDTSAYKLSLLTLAVSFDGVDAHTFALNATKEKRRKMRKLKSKDQRPFVPRRLVLGDKKGFLGHAVLKYPSGGQILVSAGHWIELVNLHTTEEAVIRVASNLYCGSYVEQWRQRIQRATSSDRGMILNQYSAQIIQNSSPSRYCNKV